MGAPLFSFWPGVNTQWVTPWVAPFLSYWRYVIIPDPYIMSALERGTGEVRGSYLRSCFSGLDRKLWCGFVSSSFLWTFTVCKRSISFLVMHSLVSVALPVSESRGSSSSSINQPTSMF